MQVYKYPVLSSTSFEPSNRPVWRSTIGVHSGPPCTVQVHSGPPCTVQVHSGPTCRDVDLTGPLWTALVLYRSTLDRPIQRSTTGILSEDAQPNGHVRTAALTGPTYGFLTPIAI